jgi:hypothetical protein
MAMSTSKKILGLGLVSLVVLGCEGLLGSFEVVPDVAGPAETGTTDVQISTNDGSVNGNDSGPSGDSGADAATHTGACERSLDCPAIAIEPAGCAVVQCINQRCEFRLVDKDNDNHLIAGCKVDGQLQTSGVGSGDAGVQPADDCSDDDPTVFPGASCAKTESGQPITFPTGSPVGVCKAGKWQCGAGGAVCKGAVGPEAGENCLLKNDANCNGVPDDTCDCVPTSTSVCGNVNNLPSPCAKGTRTCGSDGKWGACIGNVEPKARDCSSTADNDCNGQADRAETACKCPGGLAQGAVEACEVPKKLGACADGTHTCVPSPDKQTGVFNACKGPLPGRPNCLSEKEDIDCNGSPDALDVACGSPCLDGNGNKVAAAQKFTAGMWGCRGTFPFGKSVIGCSGAVCSVETWAKYSRSGKVERPTHKYWVAEKLNYGPLRLGTSGACWAYPGTGTDCGSDSSMAVCPTGGASTGAVSDAEGNVCNWSDCSYNNGATTPNDYLGGCSGNVTGGTLCCP